MKEVSIELRKHGWNFVMEKWLLHHGIAKIRCRWNSQYLYATKTMTLVMHAIVVVIRLCLAVCRVCVAGGGSTFL